ncbi:MAG: hypothetical protein HUK20_09845 [Fibrobacter sp.]|nr:hypothetical protein [Fibrobacter sp.]
MDKGNLTGLDAENFNLLRKAKGGDQDACGKLYVNFEGEVKRMHRYGPDGEYPRKFGYTRSRKGATYEEASGYCYECFYHCVRTYDMESGTPFLAWLRKIFAMRALDWVENRNPEGLLREGDALSDSFDAPSVSARDFENASVDAFRGEYGTEASFDESEIMNAEALEKIRRYVHDHGDVKLGKFVDAYIRFGNDGKNHMQAIADHLHVRRQTAYNYLNAVQGMVKGHFGNHFFGCD